MTKSKNPSSNERSDLPSELAEASPWIRGLARFGFWALGFIHLVVGYLACRLAAGMGGSAESLRSALSAIYQPTFGGILLVILALGFLSHAAWKFVQAIWNPDRVAHTFIGACLRVGFAFSGMIYVGLAFSALRLVFFGGDGGQARENQHVESATATLLTQPWGKALVGVVVLAVAGFAVGSFVQAWRARFRDQLANRRISDQTMTIITVMGRIAYAARGLVFLAVAGMFAQAALHADPSQAGGMSKAMRELLLQPYGRWLLGAAGAGFIAYGLFCWSLMRYRKLPLETDRD